MNFVTNNYGKECQYFTSNLDSVSEREFEKWTFQISNGIFQIYSWKYSLYLKTQRSIKHQIRFTQT